MYRLAGSHDPLAALEIGADPCLRGSTGLDRHSRARPADPVLVAENWIACTPCQSVLPPRDYDYFDNSDTPIEKMKIQPAAAVRYTIHPASPC
jgi:hypothetical protein